MKWIQLLPVVVLLFGTEVFGQGGNFYVRVRRENVRAKPNGAKMGEVLAGTEVEVLERRPNWVKVRFTGWMWEKSLTSDSMMVDGFTVMASHILVETEEEANKILDQLRQGAAFEELARQYSVDRASGVKGGDLGTFSRGDFREEFEDAVFRLKKGGISGVVKTELGYHIIKRTE